MMKSKVTSLLRGPLSLLQVLAKFLQFTIAL